jgi:hypothetical protein
MKWLEKAYEEHFNPLNPPAAGLRPSTLQSPVSKTSCAPHWPTRVRSLGAKLLLTQSKKAPTRQDPNPYGWGGFLVSEVQHAVIRH